MKKSFILIFSLLNIYWAGAQQTEKASYGTFLLKNGMVHTVTQGTKQADVLIKDGRIVEIGVNLNIDNVSNQIDCQGKHIYPGMIDSGTKLGLAEIGAISLTQDHNETGDFTPHMEALTAVNPSSVNIPVTRVNGVTSVLAVPSGSLFPGKSALIHLHGYTPQQMYAGFKGSILNFPSSGKRNRWDRRTKDERKTAYEKNMSKLNEFWENVIIHAKLDSAATKNIGTTIDYNPQLDALKEVAMGSAKLIINVNKKSDIIKAIEWSNKNGLQPIFSGVADGWRVADSLAKYDIPVLVGPILSLPSRNSDKYSRPYENAGLMQQAGVLVAIKTDETENVRNLPYNAGFAANYGMGTEEALKAVTINPAKIFGLDTDLGSIEEGKIANLFVSDGDPFETKTQIYQLFINGWNVPLESRHTLLYEEFLERDPGISK